LVARWVAPDRAIDGNDHQHELRATFAAWEEVSPDRSDFIDSTGFVDGRFFDVVCGTN
jgi:hypothetical protein